MTFKDIHFTLALLMLGVFLYIAATLYITWLHTTTDSRGLPVSGWKRLIVAAEGSATILWAKFVMLVASMVGFIGDIGDFLGQPEIRDYANTLFGNPKIMAGVMLAVMYMTVKYRRRTLPT